MQQMSFTFQNMEDHNATIIWYVNVVFSPHFFEYNCHSFQDIEPLMRAPSKLIYISDPDLVLFVGEALVGNDAVDQLSKFNQVWFLF